MSIRAAGVARPLGGQSEGLYADDLCRNCHNVRVPDRTRAGQMVSRSRRDVYFYRPGTVWVMPPKTFTSNLVVVWDGVRLPQTAQQTMVGVVKIDGALYVARGHGDSVALYAQGGACVRECALQLSQQRMEAIYQAQRAS